MTSLPNRPDVRPLPTTSFQQWLQQGEVLYQSAMQEFRALEGQMDELERRIAAKQTELNHIAGILNKPAVEPSRRSGASGSGGTIEGEPLGAPDAARPLPGRVVRPPGVNGV